MLDTLSLRVAFGIVALTMLVLFYLVTYRTTRSAYCGWWCLSLALFLLGSCAYYFDGTEHQVWANPLGNVLLVLGTTNVWAGARSLRARSTRAWQLLTAPAITAVASGLDTPATNTWSGGPFLLGSMSLFVGLASWELWQLQRRPVPAAGIAERTWVTVVRSMVVASGLFSAFYAGRLVAFVVGGQDSPLFTTLFGSQISTLLTTVLLATVSFSMSSLSNVQEAGELRLRADVDGLTGLLNRAAFLRLAQERLAAARDVTPVTVIVADLDDFKDINDTLGHAAGDHALREFAGACRAAVRPGDVVGRLGGDEFVLLLPGASVERCRAVTTDISRWLQMRGSIDGVRLPTISYGIAGLDEGRDLEAAIARADVALYRAKAQGRDRSVADAVDDAFDDAVDDGVDDAMDDAVDVLGEADRPDRG